MRIGIIGGPYYWNLWGLKAKEEKTSTVFGSPADSVFSGKVGRHDVYTLLRHGSKNEYAPSQLPFLANVFALASMKLDFVIHVTACGALNKKYQVGDIFLFDQLIDCTKSRPSSFGNAIFSKVNHLNFGTPIDKTLGGMAEKFFRDRAVPYQYKGTMLTEEGPRFCTAAESKMFAAMGADAVNMTTSPEVYLFRELAIPVLAMSLVTNVIDENAEIYSEDIADNINKKSDVIPHNIYGFISQLPDNIKLPLVQINQYNIEKLDLRNS